MIKLAATILMFAMAVSCESQADRKAECHDTVAAVCEKSEVCGMQSEESCMLQSASEGMCMEDVSRSVAELEKCQADLQVADCGALPISCY